MRKKILLLVAACTMAVSMAGCGSKETTLKSDKTKQAVSESATVEDKVDKSDSSNKVDKNNETDDSNKADDNGKTDKNSRNNRNTKPSENKGDDLDNFDDEDLDVDLDDDIDEDLDEDINDKSDNTKKASENSSSIIDEHNDVYYFTGDLIKDSTKGDTVLYTNEDGTEKLAVTVLRNQPYTDEEVYDICMEQIKSVYGENYDISCYASDEYFFDEYDFLEGNDNDDYSDVKVYLYTDGETIIIIEHGVLHGAGFPSTAEDLIDSLVIG